MNEFGRSAQERREYDRIRYPNSDVLRNRLDLRDQADLDIAERLNVASRLASPFPVPARRMHVDGIRALHHHLFQDIYEWAGEFRKYPTGRQASPFARPEFIHGILNQLFQELHSEGQLIGLKHEAFAARAAYFVNELNAVHPFVEGNGRTQRVWLRQLSQSAGFALDLSPVRKSEWYDASAEGFHQRHEAMTGIILRNSKPLSRVRARNRSETGGMSDDRDDPDPERPKPRSRSRGR